jgi:hypothetical protein
VLSKSRKVSALLKLDAKIKKLSKRLNKYYALVEPLHRKRTLLQNQAWTRQMKLNGSQLGEYQRLREPEDGEA